MSEYRRFVAYIYQYADGVKQRNAGYIKVEVRNQICRMQIMIQTGRAEAQKIRIFGFVRKKEVLFAIPLGEAESRKASLSATLSMDVEKLNDTEYGVDNLQGIWLKDEVDRDFISVWDDEKIDTEKFSLEQEREEEQQLMEVEAASVEDADEKTESSLEQRWEHFCSHYPRIYPFSEEDEIHCLQIMPKDISFLGENEWQYGTNPFLRQGFLRYGHLILARQKNGQFFLGVPGINYDSQEQHLARMYGFPEFRKGMLLEGIQITEKEEAQRFGYWYHFL